MRTPVKMTRNELTRLIMAKQAEFRRIHSLNIGVIRGAIDTQDLQLEIFELQAILAEKIIKLTK
jgi:hypothetical protein